MSLPCTQCIAVLFSDGVVRVFSASLARRADEATLSAFEQEVKDFTTPATKTEIGGIKVADLPGMEALQLPGMSSSLEAVLEERSQGDAMSRR